MADFAGPSVQTVEAAAIGTDPEVALIIFGHAAYYGVIDALGALTGDGYGVVDVKLRMEILYAAKVTAHPERPLAVAEQRAYGTFRLIVRHVVEEMARGLIKTAQSTEATNPELSFQVFSKTADEVGAEARFITWAVAVVGHLPPLQSVEPFVPSAKPPGPVALLIDGAHLARRNWMAKRLIPLSPEIETMLFGANPEGVVSSGEAEYLRIGFRQDQQPFHLAVAVGIDLITYA